MKCPHCNQEHPEGTKFCPYTGKEIPSGLKSCPNSQCVNYEKDIIPSDYCFCPMCGSELTEKSMDGYAHSCNLTNEYEFIDSFYEGRAVVMKGGKYGVIDISGNVIVPCTYFNIYRYSEGLAACQNDSDGWAFMDLNGQIVVKVAENLDVTSEIGFMEERCAVSGIVEYDDDCDRKYGYIDKTGRLCIDLQFDYAGDFHEGLAWVAKDDDNYVQFYINREGKTVFPYEYLGCHDFIGNYAVVRALHGKWFVIDKWERIVFKFPEKDYYWYDVDDKFIHYGQNGKLLWLRPEEPDKRYYWNNVKSVYGGFSEGYIAICSAKNEKWGYITETGNEAIPFIYEEAHDFKDGLAAVKVDGSWGFIDYTGMMVIKPVYNKVFGFSESRAIVQINNRWMVIDKYGKVVVG